MFIDVTVCFCTGFMVLLTDCFNVMNPDGTSYLHIGGGAAILEELAKSNTAGIPLDAKPPWEPFFSELGGIFIAVCVLLFGFTTVLNYYYQGETAIAYLLQNKHPQSA